MKKLAIGLYLLVTAALLAWAYNRAWAAPNDAAQGEMFRIIYYHVPSFAVCFVFFALSLIGSIAFLAFRHGNPSRAQIADALAVAGAEVGVVFCSVGLVTGPLWGRRAWGMWWTWDARLTTTLVLWLIYVSYLLLRRFAAGPQMQTLAAVLGIFGALDVPIVYMANRWWRTQHPGAGLRRWTGFRHGSQRWSARSSGICSPGSCGACSSWLSAIALSGASKRSPPQKPSRR